ncbi:pilus assembly protein N-terminal domain-containing protein [Acidithiobacillus sp. AMEEHan]|uniref:type II and III secretion system protein family protein n=1 Tax=Acidithiobacillus sp. AMEEHan TaxID=2994951 RepID=UPI0027E56453|nr:pilus assembly protein N-terminal domain-containing protein [Acidithiobacillus sp. AMEEHan]
MRLHRKILLALTVASLSTTSLGAEDQTLNLYAGQVKVIPTKPVKRVAVGDGKVLSTTVVEGKELLLLGDAEGETSLRVWYKDGGEEAYRVLVAPKNVGRAAEEMRELLGADGHGAQVRVVGEHLVIDGHNLPADVLMRISELQKLYPKTLILANPAPFKMEKMVWLDVNVLEVKKSAIETFGVDWTKQIAGPFVGYGKDFVGPSFRQYTPLGQDPTQPPVQGSGVLLTPPPPGLTGAIDLTNLARPLAGGWNVGLITGMLSKINFAMSNGDAYQIANPQLSARSGGETKFLAGGQVPILQALASGTVAFQNVTYKNYGIQLDFKPQVDDENNITMHVVADISDIDPATSVVLNGFNVPGFTTRRSEADINVGDGQTMVISGLVNPKTAKNLSKLPWLGDIPVLGHLFKSTDFQSGNTDLIILVTPRVVSPASLENIRQVSRAVVMKDEYQKVLPKDSATWEAVGRTLGSKTPYPETQAVPAPKPQPPLVVTQPPVAQSPKD